MKELPMLLNGHGVRATMAGTKTMTRRPVKPQPVCTLGGQRGILPAGSIAMWHGWPHKVCVGGAQPVRNPHGVPGDLLYVRETCRAEELDSGLDGIRYLADDAFVEIENSIEASNRWTEMYHYRGGEGATVPSIHMPKWAARTWLRVTGVKVERVQGITHDDAVAEGFDCYHENYECAFDGFREVWDSIYAKRGMGWDVNPWCWATSYEVTER